ncbi:MAG: methyltransferase domain-containing protein [Promethearchaeota archaeon]
MKLNLGCGYDCRKGWVNLDREKRDGVDIVHDLNKLPLPFENEKFDYVLCQDVLEHVNIIPLMNEIHRILKKGGILKIRVPHFTSTLNYEDPTHKNQFSIRTFDYFIEKVDFSYEREIKSFSKISKKLIFYKKKNIFLRIINRFLENWINKSEERQIMYETTFLRIIPTINIEIKLIK